jgi:putative DNA primase/helicase
VAPPSIHVSGNLYKWAKGCSPYEIELIHMPDWLLQLILNPKKNNKNKPKNSNEIIEGSRNNTLASVAGSLRYRGFEEENIYEELLKENMQKCNPPLSEEEVRKIAHSIAKYEPSRFKEKNNKNYNNTDLGNAKRLVDSYGKDIRYCIQMKSWLIWDGKKWIIDSGKIFLMRFAKETVENIYNKELKNAG